MHSRDHFSPPYFLSDQNEGQPACCAVYQYQPITDHIATDTCLCSISSPAKAVYLVLVVPWVQFSYFQFTLFVSLLSAAMCCRLCKQDYDVLCDRPDFAIDGGAA